MSMIMEALATTMTQSRVSKVSQSERDRRAMQRRATQPSATTSASNDDFTSLTDAQLTDAEQMSAAYEESAAALDLDEVVTQVYQIAFTEYVPGEIEGPDGPETAYLPKVRHAKIANLVNMIVWDQYWSLNEQLQQKDDPTARFGAMCELVLAVWRESEPNMTLERLRKGLDLAVVQALFFRFFPRAQRRLQGVMQSARNVHGS